MTNDVQIPPIPFRFFTLEPPHTGGRKARTGFEFQDQYTACALAGFFAGQEDFLAGRIEGVEDFEAILRTDSGWVERYYQIKSRQEGGRHWTIADLDREGVWVRFFSLYRRFLLQQFEVARRLELRIVVEGDLASELIELRQKGVDAVDAKAKLLATLSATAVPEGAGTTSASSQAVVGALIDGFLRTLRFESRVANLREATLNRIVASGDVSNEEAHRALDRLSEAIKQECLLPQASRITLETVKTWLDIPERAILQRKPLADPYEVDRQDLVTKIVDQLEKESALLLHGIPKVGKSHFVSALIDRMHKDHDYFWFAFSGSPGDNEKLLFQLATWIGQRISIWGPRDDLAAGRLQPMQALERLTKTPVGPVYVILDDCHKANDKSFLGEVAKVIAHGWKDSKLIFIGEEKLPEITASGVQAVPVGGFEPKEAIIYLMKLGIDVRGALAELGMLCVQADGHPVLLKAIATELPGRPSPADVIRLSSTLLSALSARPFLEVLSAKLIRSFRTDAHRTWLRRLAVVTFPFRRGLAMELALMHPKIEISTADWLYFASQILDQTGAEQFIVPPLLRPLVLSESREPDSKSILLASARFVFRNTGTASRINFWDFHGAILALVLAERYEEAAMRFSLVLASRLPSGSFLPFELLFMVLNGDFVQAKLEDPFARFLLLIAEIHLRLQDEKKLDYARIVALLRHVRRLPRANLTATAFLQIRMNLHSMISTIRVRQLQEKGRHNVREGRRAFAPLQSALRVAVGQKNADFVDLTLGLYGSMYRLQRKPDLELLRDAILTIPAGSDAIPGDAVAGIYAQYVVAKQYDDDARELCERHSLEYFRAGRGDAYLACEYAVATILLDRFSNYKEAREHVLAAYQRAGTIGASSDALARAELLIADSYWLERDYENSAAHYRRVLSVSFTDPMLNQWVREKLADCLITLGRYPEANLHLVMSLRMERATLRPEESSRLYARLVYSYGLGGQLAKAAIACQGLCGVAQHSGAPEFDILSATLSDWLLHHFEYSDPIIPKSTAQIRDSASLSEVATERQITAWKERGPLFVRPLILLGAVFELLGKFGRSTLCYEKARMICQTAEPTRLTPGAELFLTTRICRMQIRRKLFPKAAASFAKAVEEVLAAKRRDAPEAAPGGVAFAVLSFVEPVLGSLSDTELLNWFGALDTEFRGEVEVRAWLLFRESELLFDRLLVQKGKPRLLEAEALALAHGQRDLLLSIRHKKLFTRFQEMYGNQIDWLLDVLEAGLLLASDHTASPMRDGFGRNVLIAANQIARGPMQSVAARISRYGERWRQNAFLFSMLAVWAVCRQFRMRPRILRETEKFLHAAGAPLTEEDSN